MNPKKSILNSEFPNSGNKYPVNHQDVSMAKATIGRAGFTVHYQGEGLLTLNKCFFPYFSLFFPHSENFSILSLYPKHDFVKSLWTLLMLSYIRELGIMSRRKLFRAEFKRTHTQITSFLAPLHAILFARMWWLVFPSNSEVARPFLKHWDLWQRVLLRFLKIVIPF